MSATVTDGAGSDTPLRHNRSSWTSLLRPGLVLAAVAVIAAAVFWTVRSGLTDDGYITLDYARQLAFHGIWGMIPGEVANTQTSPFNVLVLAGLTAVLRAPVLALGVLFVASAVVTAAALGSAARECGLPRFVGVLATFLIFSNVLVLSSVGLEMTLGAALLSLLLLVAIRRSPPWFGIVTGVVMITRLDLLVFVAVLLAARPSLLRGWWKMLLSAACIAVPWYVFSWFFFGSAIPDTLVIKQTQYAQGSPTFGNGLQLLAGIYPSAIALVVAVGALALLVLAGWLVSRLVRSQYTGPRRVRLWAMLGFAGVAYYLVYLALGVPPYHWYYDPTLIALSIFLAGAVGAVLTSTRRLPTRIAARALAVATVGALAAQVGFVVYRGLPWRVAAVTTNWASPADYARIGTALHTIVGDKVVAGPGETGTLIYFCHCRIVDEFSDRGDLVPYLNHRLEGASPLERALLEWNYARFQAPQPLRVDYRLRWEAGHGPDPLWNTDSPWKGPGHLVLTEVAN